MFSHSRRLFVGCDCFFFTGNRLKESSPNQIHRKRPGVGNRVAWAVLETRWGVSTPDFAVGVWGPSGTKGTTGRLVPRGLALVQARAKYSSLGWCFRLLTIYLIAVQFSN